MIEFKKCPVIDGRAYADIETAQHVMLEETFRRDAEWTAAEIAGHIVANKDAVLNILTFTRTSRPKARKANGAVRKPRRAAAVPAKPEPELPLIKA